MAGKLRLRAFDADDLQVVSAAMQDSLVAIKDMLWRKGKETWQVEVVPVGEGIVKWNEVAQGLKELKFNGTISLHGEYEAKDLAERGRLAKQELATLKQRLG